jgi:uncharacterized protein YndB with AHSA1/START domain/quinol monooxygenase YgiN
MNSTALSVSRSIVVEASQDRCFEVFVNMTEWWPLATHTIGEAPAHASIVQTRVGGRWYDIDKNGDEHEIGRVLAYEPPNRIVLSWEISCTWKHDASVASQVEVRFVPETPARTRVELEHRGLEAYGEGAQDAQKLYDGEGAWTYVLAQYAKAFGPVAGFAATAFHFYADEYREAFQDFCERVLKHAAGASGLLRFELLHDAAGKRLIGASLWESRAAFQAALPTILALGAERRPEWSARPDESYFSDSIASWHATGKT